MAARQTTNSDVKSLEQALAARFGWQIGAHGRDELLEAITIKADRLKLDRLAYCRLAIASTGELEVLAEMVSNSETRFFRDSEQFRALGEKIIPALINERATERRFDIWSAACSTGEEPYSLAILLRESLPEAESWKLNLFATDLRGSAIISASQGRYRASTISGVDSRIRDNYFIEAGTNGRETSFDIAPEVRRMVAFRRANIYDPQFWRNVKPEFDLIICNNLLIYFHALAVRQTIERIAGVLRRGGLLSVMKNEVDYVNHPSLRLDGSLPGAFFRKV